MNVHDRRSFCEAKPTGGRESCFVGSWRWRAACSDGLVEQLFLAFGSGFSELREGFVELALDGGLVAEEELLFCDLDRVDEEIGEGGVGVGFGVVLEECVDPVVEEGGFDALESFHSPGGGDGAVGQRALDGGLRVQVTEELLGIRCILPGFRRG